MELEGFELVILRRSPGIAIYRTGSGTMIRPGAPVSIPDED